MVPIEIDTTGGGRGSHTQSHAVTQVEYNSAATAKPQYSVYCTHQICHHDKLML